MDRAVIDKANELTKLIEQNKIAIQELQNYENGKTLYTSCSEYSNPLSMYRFPVPISFEPWEVRLMIHNKQQRIKALEKELEEL